MVPLKFHDTWGIFCLFGYKIRKQKGNIRAFNSAVRNKHNTEIKHDVYFSRERQKFNFLHLLFNLAFVLGNEQVCVYRECVIFPYFSEGFLLEFDKKGTK